MKSGQRPSRKIGFLFDRGIKIPVEVFECLQISRKAAALIRRAIPSDHVSDGQFIVLENQFQKLRCVSAVDDAGFLKSDIETLSPCPLRRSCLQ